ncbi:DUF4244 domain-containing protein [Tessaracoccus sp. Z1128]
MAHPVPSRAGRARALAQRGLTTVEYALGLLAAATVALVLLRIFGDNTFYKTLFDWVINVFTTVANGG